MKLLSNATNILIIFTCKNKNILWEFNHKAKLPVWCVIIKKIANGEIKYD